MLFALRSGGRPSGRGKAARNASAGEDHVQPANAFFVDPFSHGLPVPGINDTTSDRGTLRLAKPPCHVQTFRMAVSQHKVLAWPPQAACQSLTDP
ncbi:hypothetical protein AA100600_0051 [Gluconobacter thailandicus F149-1 = NBRC 100600]|nr:hypothetical protein AA100600_0051 [Gluconobacter thailandicus F149-1 = NBRC 100600]